MLDTSIIHIFQIIVCVFICYLVGLVQIGDILTKRIGIDIRSSGTGNPGASNIFNEVGPFLGVLVFFLDVAKGLIPIVIANFTDIPTMISCLSSISMVLGHQTRIPLKNSGGTGMATAMGSGIGLIPKAAFVSVIPSAIILLFTKKPSYTGVSAFFITIVAGWLIYMDLLLSVTIFILSASVLIKFKLQYQNLSNNNSRYFEAD